MPGRGALASGVYGGALGYSISSSMQTSGYSEDTAGFVGGAAGGGGAGALAAFFAGESIGGGTFLGAWAGAAGAATANAVSGWLKLINEDFGDLWLRSLSGDSIVQLPIYEAIACACIGCRGDSIAACVQSFAGDALGPSC